MSLAVSNIGEIIEAVRKEKLYPALLKQLNKDLHLANITYRFADDLLPADFLSEFGRFLYRLIHHRFDEYLNLLYIVDVAEHQVKGIKETDLEQLVPQVAFLILKREWQKVWYRSQY